MIAASRQIASIIFRVSLVARTNLRPDVAMPENVEDRVVYRWQPLRGLSIMLRRQRRIDRFCMVTEVRASWRDRQEEGSFRSYSTT